jgi:hypothetical protein
MLNRSAVQGSETYRTIELFVIISHGFQFLAYASQVWISYFVCKLHEHDLFCYAGAMYCALEDGDEGVLEDLNKLEISVTTRFRSASATWVRTVLANFAIHFTSFLLLVTHLMSDPTFGELELTMTCFISFQTVFIVLLTYPIASVSAVFEYDVLRTLNQPLVLHRAIRLFGPQMFITCMCSSGVSAMVAR